MHGIPSVQIGGHEILADLRGTRHRGSHQRDADADFDFVVLDTPPALGILTVNALVASTHLLVPIQAAYFAIEGTDDLLETYGRIRARPNPDLKILGVLITLFDKRTNISRDTHEQIRAVFGER